MSTEVKHNELDPNIGITPPRTKVSMALGAVGKWQWTLEMECVPGDEDNLLERVRELNAVLAATYRQECMPNLPADVKRYIAAFKQLPVASA